MDFLLHAAECIAFHTISDYCSSLVGIILPFFLGWLDFLLRLGHIFLVVLSFRLYCGRPECYVVETLDSVVCLKNVDVSVLVSCWLGWTVNCLLGISSDVSSGYFIFETSLRLPHACTVQQLARHLDRVYTKFRVSPLLAFSILGFPPHFQAALGDLKSVSWLCKQKDLGFVLEF